MGDHEPAVKPKHKKRKYDKLHPALQYLERDALGKVSSSAAAECTWSISSIIQDAACCMKCGEEQFVLIRKPFTVHKLVTLFSHVQSALFYNSKTKEWIESDWQLPEHLAVFSLETLVGAIFYSLRKRQAVQRIPPVFDNMGEARAWNMLHQCVGLGLAWWSVEQIPLVLAMLSQSTTTWSSLFDHTTMMESSSSSSLGLPVVMTFSLLGGVLDSCAIELVDEDEAVHYLITCNAATSECAVTRHSQSDWLLLCGGVEQHVVQKLDTLAQLQWPNEVVCTHETAYFHLPAAILEYLRSGHLEGMPSNLSTIVQAQLLMLHENKSITRYQQQLAQYAREYYTHAVSHQLVYMQRHGMTAAELAPRLEMACDFGTTLAAYQMSRYEWFSTWCRLRVHATSKEPCNQDVLLGMFHRYFLGSLCMPTHANYHWQLNEHSFQYSSVPWWKEDSQRATVHCVKSASAAITTTNNELQRLLFQEASSKKQANPLLFTSEAFASRWPKLSQTTSSALLVEEHNNMDYDWLGKLLRVLFSRVDLSHNDLSELITAACQLLQCPHWALSAQWPETTSPLLVQALLECLYERFRSGFYLNSSWAPRVPGHWMILDALHAFQLRGQKYENTHVQEKIYLVTRFGDHLVARLHRSYKITTKVEITYSTPRLSFLVDQYMAPSEFNAYLVDAAYLAILSH